MGDIILLDKTGKRVLDGTGKEAFLHVGAGSGFDCQHCCLCDGDGTCSFGKYMQLTMDGISDATGQCLSWLTGDGVDGGYSLALKYRYISYPTSGTYCLTKVFNSFSPNSTSCTYRTTITGSMQIWSGTDGEPGGACYAIGVGEPTQDGVAYQIDCDTPAIGCDCAYCATLTTINIDVTTTWTAGSGATATLSMYFVDTVGGCPFVCGTCPLFIVATQPISLTCNGSATWTETGGGSSAISSDNRCYYTLSKLYDSANYFSPPSGWTQEINWPGCGSLAQFNIIHPFDGNFTVSNVATC